MNIPLTLYNKYTDVSPLCASVGNGLTGLTETDSLRLLVVYIKAIFMVLRHVIYLANLKFAVAKTVGFYGVHKFEWIFEKYQPTGLDTSCINSAQIMRKLVSHKPSESFLPSILHTIISHTTMYWSIWWPTRDMVTKKNMLLTISYWNDRYMMNIRPHTRSFSPVPIYCWI